MARVESYTADQINQMFEDKDTENATKFADKTAMSNGLSAAGAAKDNVPTADGAGAWTWAPQKGGTGTGDAYKGVWSAATAYSVGDQVSYNDTLWVAQLANANSQPSLATISDAGGMGEGTDGYLGTWSSDTYEMVMPIKVSRAVQLAAISLFGRFGMPELSIGIATVRPAVGSTTVPATIKPMTSSVERTDDEGTGWHRIILDEVVSLAANTQYWIYVKSNSDLQNMGASANVNFYSPVLSPNDTADLSLVRMIGGTWHETRTATSSQSDIYMPYRIAEDTTAQWRPIADYTGSVSGGSVGGVTVCDQWQDTKQLTSSSFQSRPSGGFDFRQLNGGGPRMGFKTYPQTKVDVDPTYGWTQDNYAVLVAGETGWYNATLSYSCRFHQNAPDQWQVGFNYPEQDDYAHPVWDVIRPVDGNVHKFAWNFGPIHLTAGDEIDFYAQTVGAIPNAVTDLGDDQFCLILTTLSKESPSGAVWTPPEGEIVYFP